MNKIHFLLTGIAFFALIGSCEQIDDNPVPGDINFRLEMRKLVMSIAAYSRAGNPDFLVIPQNGEALITNDGLPEGPLVSGYLQAINGVGREGLFYGEAGQDNHPTTPATTASVLPFLNLLQQQQKVVLITDYASDPDLIQKSLTQCTNRGFIPFVASDPALNCLPTYPAQPVEEHTDDIVSLADARNFLCMIRPGRFASQQTLLDTLLATNYDILILEPYIFRQQELIDAGGIQRLQYKPGGGRRLVLAYLDLGTAATDHYYWQEEWRQQPPYWLAHESLPGAETYHVRYWEPDWQAILFGNRHSYMRKIVDAGFDGVYLAGVDVYKYFE